MLILHFISLILLIIFFNIGSLSSDKVAKRRINEVEEFGPHLSQQYLKNLDDIDKNYRRLNPKSTDDDLIDDIINELTKSQSYLNHLKLKNLKGLQNVKTLDFEISSEKNEKNRQQSIALAEGGDLENQQAQNENISPQLKQSSFNRADQASIDVAKVNLNGENENLLLLKPKKRTSDFLFYSILIGCVIAGLVVIVATGFCLYAMHKSKTTNLNGDYPHSYNNPKLQAKSVIRNGDKGLAQSAQMYHYQHQKQQMIAMEKANDDMKPDQSDNSDGETDEGDYTVYECPGLAPTGEMEVKNPLFKEDLGIMSSNMTSDEINVNLPPETRASQLSAEVSNKN